MRLIPLIAIASSLLMLAGCPKKPTTVPGDSSATSDTSQSSTAGMGSGGMGEARTLPGATEMPGEGTTGPAGVATVIYFDYDSSDVRAEFAADIAAHAKYLGANGKAAVRLEGHTDERGTREYNIALGERRAQAVRRALLLQGSTDPQLVTVSYGEERPASEGTEESAWSRNRRVEISYGR